MTKAQEHLLMLFKEIADICHRHDIIYYMAGGTLIGAIRHKGFIPWDDDMDILMTRDNWHKFIEVTKTDMPENRVLECQELDRDYPNMFGRYTDISSTAIHKNQVLGDGIAGYVVDILVLDPIPDAGPTYEQYRNDLMLYSDLVNPSLNYSYRWGINKKRFNKYYSRMQKEGKDKVLGELEQKMFCYEEEECPLYVMRWGGAPFLFEKDMYGSSRWATFEGVRCRVPDRTGDYLTWHYGDDWMYIPPHGEHESHEAIFSFTTDYKTIQNDYMRYLDVPSIRKSFIKRKKYFLRHMDQRLEAKDAIVRVMAEAAKIEILDKVDKFDGDLNGLLDSEQYQTLSTFFDKYYAEQGSRQMIGREDYLGIYRFHNPVLVDIDDSIIYVAVMTLIHTNRIAKAARFLEVRQWIKGDLSDMLLQAKKLIEDIRCAISDYDLGRKDTAFKKVEQLYQRYPKNQSLIMFWVRLLIEYEKYDLAQQELKRALDLFPDDGYFYKYLGDYHYECQGNTKEAYSLYDKAVSKTNNGIVLLEIKERALEDKKNILEEIAAGQDFDTCERMLRLLPDDMDLLILKYRLLTEQCRNVSELTNLLFNIKTDFRRLEFPEQFKTIFSTIFSKLGENQKMIELRVGMLYAQSVKAYQDFQKELEQLREQYPQDGNYLKLLGDTNNWLGKKPEAKDLYQQASKTDCSEFVKYELEMGL